MRKLFPSFANPETWRNNIFEKTTKEQWRQIRQKVLQRDNFTCQYCNFRAEKWQIVHHIDGNPNNNSEQNLTVICQMCNLVEHAGMGCIIQGIVDLYKKSGFNQNEIIAETRELRAKGKSDAQIIGELGLEDRTEFRQDWNYLKPLFGFVTARKAADEKTNLALEYEYAETRKQMEKEVQNTARLSDFGDKEAKQQEFQLFGKQNNDMKIEENMGERLENLTLLMIYLQSWKTGPNWMAWKGYDFQILNKLNEKGFISDKKTWKSLFITDKGIEKAKQILEKVKLQAISGGHL